MWPHLANYVRNAVQSCIEFHTLLPAQQQEPIQNSVNTYHMERVGIDLFQHKGKHYLTMADGYSGFRFADCLNNL